MSFVLRNSTFSLLLFCYVGCGEGLDDRVLGLESLGGDQFDFGECHQGVELSHTFRLVNRADDLIRILGLESSCGCLVAPGGLEATTLAPSAQLNLPVQFNSGIAQSVASAFVKVHYCRGMNQSADPEQEFLTLRVSADVIPDYRISPAEIDFGEIDGLIDEHFSQRFQVVPSAVSRVSISEIKPSAPFLSTRILTPKGSPRGYEIEVELDVSDFNESRAIEGSLLLFTDSERAPMTLVPVRARYLAPVNVEPSAVIIGSDQVGEVKQELRVATSRLSRILRVSSEPPKFRAEFAPDHLTTDHVVQLIFPPRKEPIESILQIQVAISDSEIRCVRTIEVPVYCFASANEENENDSL